MLRLLVWLLSLRVILPAASAQATDSGSLAVYTRLKGRVPPSTVRVIHFGRLAYSALACW